MITLPVRYWVIEDDFGVYAPHGRLEMWNSDVHAEQFLAGIQNMRLKSFTNPRVILIEIHRPED
jgi:hypothetical protein